MPKTFIKILLLSSLLYGCSSPSIVAPPRGYDYRRPVFTPIHEARNSSPKKYPWELFPLETDLGGGALASFRMVQGDQVFKEGERSKSCAIYKSINRRSVAPATEEALVARLSSCELVADQPNKTLSIINGFMKTQKRTADELDPHLAIIMAYGHGRKGEVRESLTWFAKVRKLINSRGSLGRAAEAGVRELLQAKDSDELRIISDDWKTEPFIRAAIAQELHLRSRTGRQVARDSKPFGSIEFDQAVNSRGSGRIIKSGAIPVVGVLLPLSGQYALLGRNTKNGIDLALGAEVSAGKVKVQYQDSGTDGETATKGMVALLDQSKADLVLGPLLAESTTAVTTLIEGREIPLISFSKRNDIELGDGIFRLGATSRSQVESLFAALDMNLKLNRIAIVYPQDSSGIEFAELFRVELNRRGLRPVLDIGYMPTDHTQLTGIARELERSGAEAVFVPDSMERVFVFYSSINAETRRNIHLLGPGIWDGHKALTTSKALFEGAIFVTPFFDRSNSELVAKFTQAYQAKFKGKPDFLAAQGFDAATMAIASLKREREEDLPFVQGFSEIEHYSGLTGEISVDSSGEIIRTFRVLAIKNGELIELQNTSL